MSVKFTEKERLMLFNQYEILKRLDEDLYDEYELKQEILLNGYTHNYDELVEGFNSEVDSEISKFVFDVLQMHRVLLFSYEDLTPEEKQEVNLKDIKFRGFDGNEETDYYMYAKFVLKKLKRFEEIYDDGKVEFNSHWNTLNRYKRMLNTWNEVSTGRYNNISLQDIKKIINS
ncbi:MAG: YfbU family protein [Clostridium perfringens]|nr:YfbU family protein [Clostridium perfringens]